MKVKNYTSTCGGSTNKVTSCEGPLFWVNCPEQLHVSHTMRGFSIPNNMAAT